MSTIKLNSDCIRLGHLGSNAQSLQNSNARSLQGGSQSERACYCNHIIKCGYSTFAVHHKKSLVPVCAKDSIGRLFDDTKSRDKNIEYPNLNTVSNL